MSIFKVVYTQKGNISIHTFGIPGKYVIMNWYLFQLCQNANETIKCKEVRNGYGNRT